MLIFATKDNSEIALFQFKSGVNAIAFCGTGEMCSVVVGTFSGFVNSYYSKAPLANGEMAPADDRVYPGVPFGNMQWVHCISQASSGCMQRAYMQRVLTAAHTYFLLQLTPNSHCSSHLLPAAAHTYFSLQRTPTSYCMMGA